MDIISDSFNLLIESIKKKERVTVITGAGVSTDAGIPDFQSTDNSWAFDVSREEAITARFLYSQPVKFWEIYNTVFPPLEKDIEPTASHKFVKDLEDIAEVRVITQNVDGLHQKAGSKKVLEIHGNLKNYRCDNCGLRTPAHISEFVPVCEDCGELVRPDLVMFRDQVPAWKAISADAKAYTGVVLFMGTSLNVYPLAALPEIFNEFSPLAETWWWSMNPENVAQFRYFNHIIDAPLSFPYKKLEK